MVISIVSILLSVFALVSAQEKPFVWKPPKARIRKLHEDPAIYFIKHFVTDQETKHLRELAMPKLSRSMINASSVDDCRTSYSAFFDNNEDEVVKRVASRAAAMVGQPLENVELQLVHYNEGQKFDPHHDYLPEDLMKSRKSQRLMTFFVYINDLEPDAGGETVFPHLNLTIHPQKNAAVFWRNLDGQYNKDERTLHGGNPVKRGEKWAINIWIHDQKVG